MYVNIRGTNGSGKTTLLRMLVNDCDQSSVFRRILEVPATLKKRGDVVLKVPMTYGVHPKLGGGVWCVGDYTQSDRTTSPGCDRVKTQAAIRTALETAHAWGGASYIFYEGVLVSTIYGSWAEWTKAQPRPSLWAYLDTPVEKCLQRIQERNGGKPIKEQLVRDKVRMIDRTRTKAALNGIVTVVLNPSDPLASLYRELKLG